MSIRLPFYFILLPFKYIFLPFLYPIILKILKLLVKLSIKILIKLQHISLNYFNLFFIIVRNNIKFYIRKNIIALTKKLIAHFDKIDSEFPNLKNKFRWRMVLV